MRPALVFLAAISIASVAASAAPGARAGLPPCPTQAQLAARGAKPGQVTSPAQTSTGTFPLTATVIVPDEQCSYQGVLGLLIVYFHLTPAQAAAVQAHLAYECRKGQKCTSFAMTGSNTQVTTDAATGKETTKVVSTLNVIDTAGAVQGEVSAKFAPVSAYQCQVVATALWAFGGGSPVNGHNLGDLLCPRNPHHH